MYQTYDTYFIKTIGHVSLFYTINIKQIKYNIYITN